MARAMACKSVAFSGRIAAFWSETGGQDGRRYARAMTPRHLAGARILAQGLVGEPRFRDAADAVRSFGAHQGQDLAGVMIARQKASIAFEATLQVRNKLLGAYKDVMSMPV